MQLHGLTPKQIKMCDTIWALNTEQELMEWFYSLPDSQKFDAHALINLMFFEEIDHVIERQSADDMHEARELLSQF